MDRTILLFVLWETARNEAHENAILDDIKANFRILKQFEVLWPEATWERHLQSFYGLISPIWGIKRMRNGTGAFKVIVVDDPAPQWDERANMRGKKDLVDVNAYDAKRRYRKLCGVKDAVHCSVNLRETRQNLAMLTGQTLDEFLTRDDLDGGTAALSTLPPPDCGWRDMAQFFRIMGECTHYAVLRNADSIGDAQENGIHDALEIIVRNINEFSAFSGAAKVKSNAHHAAYVVNIGKTPVRMNLRTPGDGYCDVAWETAMLATRRRDRNGIFVLDQENAKWSHLYHSLAHMRTPPADATRVPDSAGGDIEGLKAQLADWMRQHGYSAYRPLDAETPFHPENLPPGIKVKSLHRGIRHIVDVVISSKFIIIHLFPACGVPGIFRMQARIGGLFKIDLCLGTLRDTVIIY